MHQVFTMNHKKPLDPQPLHGNSPLSPVQSPRTYRQAFSLIEVVLSLGIIAFAFVAIVGLIPVGLQTFRDSVDKTVETQIVQKLTAIAQQTEFSKLDDVAGASDTAPEYYYFNDEGEFVDDSDKAKSLYTAAIWKTGSTTELPAGATTSSMVTLNIRIYANKGLFDGDKPAPQFGYRAYSAHVADYGQRM
jgi:uncharacterized protein (TIGR02598 family)